MSLKTKIIDSKIIDSIKKNYGYLILYIIIFLPWIAFFATSIGIAMSPYSEVESIANFILAGFLLPTVVLLLSSILLYLLMSNRISERTAKFINKVSLTMAIIILLIVGLTRLLSPFSYNPIIVAYPHMALIMLGVGMEKEFYEYFLFPTEVIVYVGTPESGFRRPELNINLFSIPVLVAIFLISVGINKIIDKIRRPKFKNFS